VTAPSYAELLVQAGYVDGRALLDLALRQYGVCGLAKRLARSHSAVSRWASGERPLPRPVVAWLLRTYG
jgi:hypothetical protein